jgi:hypothetical protein
VELAGLTRVSTELVFHPSFAVKLTNMPLKPFNIGAIKNVSAMRPENLLRGTFTITGEKGELNVFFTLTPETKPKIQELDLFVKE